MLVMKIEALSEFSFMFGDGLLERLVKCEEMEVIGLVF